MRNTLLISIFTLLAIFTCDAQNIVLGERVPEVKSVSWLKGAEPAQTQLTYIEFFHSSNPACIASLEHLKKTIEQLQGRLRVLVIAQNKDEKATQILASHQSDLLDAGIDTSNKVFVSFGVSYVPFGVLVDAKNRALWMGSSMQLTPVFIEKISE